MTAENISPEPLATDLRSADDRDRPSCNDVLVSGLSEIVGGPVGRHALIGRQRFLTPLRVMFMIALVALALGWTTKSPCLQSVGDGGPDQKVANWAGQRAYFELCYSDTVPLYGAELLSEGKFPYKSSWRETDATGKQRIQYDGTPAVRYMEYPVLTGVYQYTAMALAKTYTAVTKTVAAVPVVAEVVMFFNFAWFREQTCVVICPYGRLQSVMTDLPMANYTVGSNLTRNNVVRINSFTEFAAKSGVTGRTARWYTSVGPCK